MLQETTFNESISLPFPTINLPCKSSTDQRPSTINSVISSTTSDVDSLSYVCVTPYIRVFEFNCKQRWIGMTLDALLHQELQLDLNDVLDNPPSIIHNGNIEHCLEDNVRAGIYVNGNRVQLNHRLCDGDKIKYSLLCKEPLVNVLPPYITIIINSPQLLVCIKPSGLPCLPQGKFQKLSLTSILQSCILKKNDGSKPQVANYLHPINRLDRQTSGLVFFSKSKRISRILTSALVTTNKYYIAKLTSRFPTPDELLHIGTYCKQSSKPQSDNIDPKKSFTHNDDADARFEWTEIRLSSGDVLPMVICRAKISLKQHQINKPLHSIPDESFVSLNLYHSIWLLLSIQGKEALSLFVPLTHDAHPIILCRPVTGRTHQIRSHLMSLGVAIYNDHLYSTLLEKGDVDFGLLKEDEIVDLTERLKGDNKSIPADSIDRITEQSEAGQSFKYSIDGRSFICLHSLKYTWRSMHYLVSCRTNNQYISLNDDCSTGNPNEQAFQVDRNELFLLNQSLIEVSNSELVLPHWVVGVTSDQIKEVINALNSLSVNDPK